MVAPTVAAAGGERVLLARLVAGDESALGELYDAHSALVFGVARRVLADPVAAEDVCQEVFVHVWTNAAAVDLDRCTIRGWLSVLAHRRAVDAVRRAERAREREERSSRLSLREAQLIDLADRAAHNDAALRARQAIAQLPDEQRRVLHLAFWEGCSYREAAELLGIPEGTAKSRIRLALARLASALDEVQEG
jgi:RNA polymerase sigma-70 factor (ECF subfamily)